MTRTARKTSGVPRSEHSAARVDFARTEDLVRACVDGNDAAKAQFYAEYRDLVRKAISWKLAQIAPGPLHGELDDICNELFLRLLAGECPMLRKIERPKAVAGWLMTVAHRHAVDYVRKALSREKVQVAAVREAPTRYAAPEAIAARREQAAILEQCLDSLASSERLILGLFFVEGLKYNEIADMCGMNINTVAARLRRAKLKLRVLLEGEGCHD